MASSERDAAHGRAPVGGPVDQPLGVELHERGPDRGPPHAISLAQVELDQPLARREHTFEDLVAELIGDGHAGGLVSLSPPTALAVNPIVDNPVADVERSGNPMTSDRTQVAIVGGGRPAPAGPDAPPGRNRMPDPRAPDQGVRDGEDPRRGARAGQRPTSCVTSEWVTGWTPSAFVHEGTHLAVRGRMTRIDFMARTGKAVTVYGRPR